MNLSTESEVNAAGQSHMWQILSVHTTLVFAHYSYTTQVCKQKLGGMHTLLMRTYLICGWLLWNGTHSTHLWWREKDCKKVLVSPVRGPGDTESLATAPAGDNHQNKFSEVSSEAQREFSFQFDFQTYMHVCMHVHVHACEGDCGDYGEAHATVSREQAEEWVSSLHLYVDSRDWNSVRLLQ